MIEQRSNVPPGFVWPKGVSITIAPPKARPANDFVTVAPVAMLPEIVLSLIENDVLT